MQKVTDLHPSIAVTKQMAVPFSVSDYILLTKPTRPTSTAGVSMEYVKICYTNQTEYSLHIRIRALGLKLL